MWVGSEDFKKCRHLKSTPFLYHELVYDIGINGCESTDKSTMILLLEYENLVYVYYEDLGFWLVHECSVYVKISINNI